MDACIGVAHASMLGAFQTEGMRQAAAKAAVRKEHQATGSSSARMVLDPADVNTKAAELEITSFFKLPKKERWEIIRHLQRRYQDDVVEASRGALKAEAAARLTRLRKKKEDHIRLCATRCEKYKEYIKIKPCRSLADLQALHAAHGGNTKKCAEALRDQLRLRDHVYKIKNKDVLIGQDKDEAAIARLMIALPAVVAAPLPMQPPPPPVPYPKRATHPAPTRAAVVFELKHLAAISTALAELIAVTNEGSFKAPRRRRATAPSAASAAAAAAAAAPPTAAGKRPRAPAHDEAALVGVAFEEDGVDWMVLAVEWDTDLEEVVVWYYDVDMAADEDLDEEEMNLARTEGLDLAPLECSSAAEVQSWIKESRLR
jgi:hypothetical protein